MNRNTFYRVFAGVVVTLVLCVALGCSSKQTTADESLSAADAQSGAVMAENTNLGASSSGRSR